MTEKFRTTCRFNGFVGVPGPRLLYTESIDLDDGVILRHFQVVGYSRRLLIVTPATHRSIALVKCDETEQGFFIGTVMFRLGCDHLAHAKTAYLKVARGVLGDIPCAVGDRGTLWQFN